MRLQKLTRKQYDELAIQFYKTPDPSDGGGSGEHMILATILHKLGYPHGDRNSDYRLAQRLLDQGWQDD